MSTEMTPMKRLNAGINEFRKQTSSYFKEVNLNKASPKFNPVSWQTNTPTYSKGVENDFIMIFTTKVIKQSFAINFTYIDLPLEKQVVEVTIKKGLDNSSIITSGELTIEEFKIKLNNINKFLKESSKDEATIVEKVSEIFLDKPYDLKGEIKKASKELNQLRENKRKEYKIEELESNVVKTTNEYEDAEKKSKREIKKSNEKIEVDKLEALLIVAKLNLKNKTEEIENKYKLKNLNANKEDAKENLILSSDKMNKEVEKEIDNLPKIVGKKFKM